MQEKGFICVLKAAKKLRNLTHIDVQSNSVSNELAGELAELISSNDYLDHLSLSNCALQEDGFLKVVTSLKDTNLHHLDISSNYITESVATHLSGVKIFQNKFLLKLLKFYTANGKKIVLKLF